MSESCECSCPSKKNIVITIETCNRKTCEKSTVGEDKDPSTNGKSTTQFQGGQPSMQQVPGGQPSMMQTPVVPPSQMYQLPVTPPRAQLPIVVGRHHGQGCAMEISVLEKHVDSCSYKKEENPGRGIEDRVGSYDCIGRIVFDTCNSDGCQNVYPGQPSLPPPVQNYVTHLPPRNSPTYMSASSQPVQEPIASKAYLEPQEMVPRRVRLPPPPPPPEMHPSYEYNKHYYQHEMIPPPRDSFLASRERSIEMSRSLRVKKPEFSDKGNQTPPYLLKPHYLKQHSSTESIDSFSDLYPRIGTAKKSGIFQRIFNNSKTTQVKRRRK